MRKWLESAYWCIEEKHSFLRALNPHDDEFKKKSFMYTCYRTDHQIVIIAPPLILASTTAPLCSYTLYVSNNYHGTPLM